MLVLLIIWTSKIQNTVSVNLAGGNINWSNAVIDYSNFSAVTRAVLGLRLMKYLDFSLTYAYLGWINRHFSASGPWVDLTGVRVFETEYNQQGGNIYKNRYHLHALELKLQFGLDYFITERLKR